MSAHPAVAQTESTLYAFAGGTGDGATLYGSLLEDSSGNFFGTTFSAGAHGVGTVFKLIPPGGTGCSGSAWCENVLYSFGAYSGDGAGPEAGLVEDSSGNLYGVTKAGGLGVSPGLGTVYELSPPVSPSTTWTEQVIHQFGSGSTGCDGVYPIDYRGLLIDSSGNLYGTTYQGGWCGSTTGQGGGVVFQLQPPGSTGCGGSSWCENLLYKFAQRGVVGEPAYLTGGLTMVGGNLYGTSVFGGANNYGTVYELVPPTGSCGGPLWCLNTLHDFAFVTTDGVEPYGELVFDSATPPNIYGTTRYGGTSNLGTVFSLPSGGGATTLLHSFSGTSGDGSQPFGGLVQDSSGNLYGTTAVGGAGGGMVFETNMTGTSYSKLYSFLFGSGHLDGYYPVELVIDSSGNLFGGTEAGGSVGCLGHGCGAVYKVVP